MTVGVVGLGLIGGSFAKAYAEAGHTVLATDTDAQVTAFAAVSGAVHGMLTKENLADCGLVLICVYPEAAISYMEEMGPYFGKDQVVIDCCGTKGNIVPAGMRIAREHGFTYLGGHPMAGTQYSGFKYARAGMFRGAPMVIVPPSYDDILLLSRVKELLAPAGFGSLNVTTAERHDELIAFTSQLAHIVSNAYIKSPTALDHKGFSAGSYKDMTRVAWLNPEMWAELFLDNKKNILKELDTIIDSLGEYRSAIEAGDREKLTELLLEGKLRKEQVDG